MISTSDTLLRTSQEGDRVKTLVEDLSLQEKKQLVNELLVTEELKEVWDEVFDGQIENYLETEGKLYDIFATLADRFGTLAASEEIPFFD
jgi:oligoribonuclease NrnB/cAMP/cGMP phosphodiesterase (DHH superfamily)